MGTVVTIMNEKGGVGKSTLTYSAAWNFAERGEHVLLIDMDGQKANLTYLSGLKLTDETTTIRDVLSGRESAENVIQHLPLDLSGSIDILPATVDVTNIDQSAKITAMRRFIKSVKEQYDWIFIDVNPTPDWKHVLTLSVVDAVMVLMIPDIMSMEANKGIFESIYEVQETTNQNLKVMGFLMNYCDRRTNLARSVIEGMDDVAKKYETTVLPVTVRKAVAMQEAALSHMGVTGYDAKSAVADDVRELTVWMTEYREKEGL